MLDTTLAQADGLDLVGAMPEQVDLEELIDRLYLRVNSARAEAAVAAGRMFAGDNVRAALATGRR